MFLYDFSEIRSEFKVFCSLYVLFVGKRFGDYLQMHPAGLHLSACWAPPAAWESLWSADSRMGSSLSFSQVWHNCVSYNWRNAGSGWAVPLFILLSFSCHQAAFLSQHHSSLSCKTAHLLFKILQQFCTTLHRRPSYRCKSVVKKTFCSETCNLAAGFGWSFPLKNCWTLSKMKQQLKKVLKNYKVQLFFPTEGRLYPSDQRWDGLDLVGAAYGHLPMEVFWHMIFPSYPKPSCSDAGGVSTGKRCFGVGGSRTRSRSTLFRRMRSEI